MARKPLEFHNYPDELSAFLEADKRQHAPRYGPYMGVIKHHVDGDTLDVYLDVGVNDYPYRPIRLRGIDVYERFSGSAEERVLGEQAWHYLQTLAPIGTPCVVFGCEKDRETFGRYEAYVRIVGGVELSAALREAGYDKNMS